MPKMSNGKGGSSSGKPPSKNGGSSAKPPQSKVGGSSPKTPQPKRSDVGYCRPPVEHRFKEGNTFGKGRPKDRKNEATIIDELLQRKMTLTENGKAVRVTREVGMWAGQLHKAMKGDTKAVALLSDRKRKPDELISNDELTPEDQEVFDAALKKLLDQREKDKENDDE